jgi:hypothetical protein
MCYACNKGEAEAWKDGMRVCTEETGEGDIGKRGKGAAEEGGQRKLEERGA